MQLIGVSQEGKVKLDTRPANLLSALWLQLAFAIVEDTHFRQCPSCRSWFAVAPERRRADAQYCKEACRVRAYKERKKAARRLHDEGKSPKQIARKLGTSVEIVEGWIVDPASGRGKSRTAKRSADF
jgi:predicted anti-sigma-YlaC factor YlaD